MDKANWDAMPQGIRHQWQALPLQWSYHEHLSGRFGHLKVKPDAVDMKIAAALQLISIGKHERCIW